MRHTARKLPQRVELLRLSQLELESFHLLLGFATLGDVTRDLGETDQPVLVVAYRVDDDACPEKGAILANAPTLFLVAAALPCKPERARGPAGGLICTGIEPREVLADDFFRAVAFDALTTGVPVGNQAGRIDHVEGIIGDTIHQQPKMPLALPEGVGGLVPFGNVAGNLGEADELTPLIQRINDNRGEELRAILAYPPSLGLELSAATGCFEGARRQPGLTIFLGIEHLEVPADDFIRVVSLDALGAGVPVADDAIGVEHIDGVVDDPLDQQAEPALAFEQAAPPTSPFCHLIFPSHNPC